METHSEVTANAVLAHVKQRVDQVVKEVFADPMFKEAFEDAPDFDLPLAGRINNGDRHDTN